MPGIPELLVLIILGIILFGPEQLPSLARKLARVYKYLSGIANGAKESIAMQFGPEFKNLNVADLHPKTLAQKYLAEALQEIEGLRGDLAEVRSELDAVRGTDGAQNSAEPVEIIPARYPSNWRKTPSQGRIFAAKKRNARRRRRDNLRLQSLSGFTRFPK